ncbi:MAG: GHKL domain-containing protein [Gemmatimonadota bacterium]|nr:MAG: GHKL domain-containing protein [Gemmatimonadota bacterium]
MREAGASEDEIKQAISDALSVRKNAEAIMEDHGLKHLGGKTGITREVQTESTTRISELVSVAAAFAVNCTSNLVKHIAASRSVGIAEDEIKSVLDSALLIKGEAANHVDKIAKLKEEKNRLQQLLEELQLTQAKLVQSEKMAALGKLVAGVVHEINTPIGTINSVTDISNRSVNNILEIMNKGQFHNEVKNNKQLQNSLQALKAASPATTAATERITTIINSLKSFSRLDETSFQKTDVHNSLESILTLLEHELKDHINIAKEYGDIPEIACHSGEINQVFMNLLMNAVQAIEKKGTITIRTVHENSKVCVQIADTGIGISPGRIQKLFDPSFSKKGSRVKAGIGLFTSYNIIQKHRGEIKVESEIGKGSTFTVILPTDLDEQIKT